jgi:hypothetical protein
VTFNRAEYVRAGADVAERTIRANWGPFVLTFRPDGHFSVRRTGPPPHQSGSGTYKVRANRVAFTCSCAPSEPWPYYWTVYRDTLTLRRATPDDPEGQTEPTGMVVKPWRRVR